MCVSPIAYRIEGPRRHASTRLTAIKLLARTKTISSVRWKKKCCPYSQREVIPHFPSDSRSQIKLVNKKIKSLKSIPLRIDIRWLWGGGSTACADDEMGDRQCGARGSLMFFLRICIVEWDSIFPLGVHFRTEANEQMVELDIRCCHLPPPTPHTDGHPHKTACLLALVIASRRINGNNTKKSTTMSRSLEEVKPLGVRCNANRHTPWQGETTALAKVYSPIPPPRRECGKLDYPPWDAELHVRH